MALSIAQQKDLNAIISYYGSVLGDDVADGYISQIVQSAFLCAQKKELDSRKVFSSLMDVLWEAYLERVCHSDNPDAKTILSAVQDDLNAELFDNYQRVFSTFLSIYKK